MRKTHLIASLFLVAALAPSAAPAVSVIGNSLGAACYEAVDNGGNDASTLALCTRALEDGLLRRVDRASTLTNRGIVLLRRGSAQLALEDFDYAIRLEPELGDAHVNRGAALIRLRRPAEALVSLDTAMKFELNRPAAAFFNRAVAREATNDIRGAYYDFRRAVELEPTWSEPQAELTRFSVTGG
jgi:tetratricopeptide (TPR) repeat protein